DALVQLAAVLSVGGQVIWQKDELHQKLQHQLPDEVRQRIDWTGDWQNEETVMAAVIYHGDGDQLRQVCEVIAQRKGPIISVQGFARGETNLLLERLLHERSISVNTAAAGGNA
ncbi:hypothetical protein LWT29_23105, partial [Enterobacter hormaechei]|nr:hypothetical protein [Enterobacter hormaechei]